MRRAALERTALVTMIAATLLAVGSASRADAGAAAHGNGITGVAGTAGTLACGDGVVEIGEGCDDGNISGGDGCSASCTIEPGFSCLGSPSFCASFCGDGLPVGTEECDDQNASDGDGCSSSCAREAGFSCSGSPSVCSAVCGDGFIRGPEGCDDGNMTSLDGCSACAIDAGYSCGGEPSVCVVGCGNGTVAGPEQCDDGNGTGSDGCSATCTVESGYVCLGSPSNCSTECGDGIVAGAEACDDGNSTSADGCAATCTVESGYSCLGSPSTCSTVCSDGIVAGGEACDDGDTTGGDGCAATCTVESGYNCLGSPSTCSTVCGDGIVAGAELCDDQNPDDGDCCSAGCQPTSCTLAAARDATLRKRARTDNEGANTVLALRGVVDRALVAFDLTGLDLDGVTSATLVLTVKRNRGKWGPSGQGVGVYALLEDFVEGNGAQLGTDPIVRGTGSGVTYDCALDTDIANLVNDCGATWGGGITAESPTDVVVHVRTTSGPVSFDVTPDVQAGTSAWLVRRTKRNDFTGNVRYHSRENAALLANPELAPRLLLEY